MAYSTKKLFKTRNFLQVFLRSLLLVKANPSTFQVDVKFIELLGTLAGRRKTISSETRK
jgi:hypothetical protein|nr:MAG TPA: hypothetical protein [Caudoviricetes sp.]